MTVATLFLLALQPLLPRFTSHAEPATLSGRVVDGQSGAVLVAVDVALTEVAGGIVRFSTRTDTEGRFVFSSVLEGRYLLSFLSPGYAGHDETIHLEPGEHLQILIRLQTGPGTIGVFTPLSGRGGPLAGSSPTVDLPSADPAGLTWPRVLGRSPSLHWESRGGDDPGPLSIRLRGFTSERFSVDLNGVTLNDPETGDVAWTDLIGLQGAVVAAQIRRGAEAATGSPAAFAGAVELLAAPRGNDPAGTAMVSGGSLGRRILALEGGSGSAFGPTRTYGGAGLHQSDGFMSGSSARLFPVYLGASHSRGSSTYTALASVTPISGGLVDRGVAPGYDRDNMGRPETPSGVPRTDQGRFVPLLIVGHDRPLRAGLRLSQQVWMRVGRSWHETDGSDRPSSYLRLNGIPRNFYQLPLREWLPEATAVVRHERDVLQFGWNPRLTLLSAWGETSIQLRTGRARSNWTGTFGETRNLPQGAVDSSLPLYEFRSGASWTTASLHHTAPLGRRVSLRGDVAVGYSASRVFDVAWFDHEFNRKYWFTNPRLGLNVNPGASVSGFSSLSVANRAPSILQLYDGREAFADASPRFPVRGDGSYDTRRPDVRSEIAFDMETGIRVVRSRWTAQATRFATRLKDLISPAAALNASGSPDVGNAGSARVKGWEFEGAWRPRTELRVEGSLSLLDGTYSTYYAWTRSDAGPVAIRDRSGSEIPGIPGSILHMSAIWAKSAYETGIRTDRIGPRAVGDFNPVGGFLDANFTSTRIPSYTSVDLWAGYTSRLERVPGVWQLRVDLRNVLNADIVGMGIAGPDGPELFPIAGRTLYLTLRVRTP